MFGAAAAKLRAELFSELTALHGAGINIGESLAIVSAEMRPSRLSAAIADAGRATSGGRSLSEALREHEDVFSPLTIAMIEVGERSGRLEAALRGAADFHERDFELRNLLTRELTYPIILFAAILFIPLAGNMIRIWLMESLLAALIAGAGQIFVYALVLGGPAFLIWLLVRNLSQTPEGRLRLDQIKLRLPIIGNVLRKLALSRFCRALASLYSSGVLMGTALRLAAEASGNEVIRRQFGGGATKLERGGKLSEVLSEGGLMPRAVLGMFRTGEQTGEVDAMAHKVADYLEQEAQTSIKQVAVSLAPVAIIIAGIIVAIMVISFYSGLYSF